MPAAIWNGCHVDALALAVLPDGAASLLQSIMNSLPVVVFAYDSSGLVLLAEGSALQAMQSGSGASVGRSIFEVFEGEAETLDHIRRALAGEEHVAEISLTRNGRPYRVFYTPWLDEGGRVSVVTGLALDVAGEVHEKRRAAAALWESERRVQRLEELSRRQLWDTLDATIAALAAALESRDPYTAGHQRRVAHLARAIALEMGLGVEEALGIYVASSIHDVGKIAVPAELLTRPDALSDIEMAIVRHHVEAGAEIVAPVPFPWPVREMILQHHERIDGSGYPAGLPGDDLLVGSRIIGVADTVEAMASRRPYRAPRGLHDALAHIEAASGVLFDSGVVRCCLRLFGERGFRFPRRH